jgi:hypothetical protein
MPLGATQLVDLLAGNPGHPAFLTILDTTVDAAAMSMRDNDAAAADVRTQMSAQGAQVPEWPFRQRHLGQSEAANVSVALLIAHCCLPDGWWREVGSDTPGLCRLATWVLAMVNRLAP